MWQNPKRLLLGAALALIGSGASAQIPAVTVSFGDSAYSVDEGASVAVEIRLSDDPERTVAIPLEATPGSGAGTGDFAVASEVTFVSGETSKTVTFAATEDDQDDDNETVALGFGSILPSGVSAGSPASTTVAITDDDDPTIAVSFASASYAVSEGWTVDVVATLDADPERTVTIPIQASPPASGEYSIPGSVTFHAGEIAKPVNFATVNDIVVESTDEIFTLSFGSTLPTRVSIGSQTTSAVTVTDDDAPAEGEVELAALAVSQGGESMYPVFNPRVRHYAIRCRNASTLRVTATARDASHELAVNNIPAPGMSVTRDIVVNSDHDVVVRVSAQSESALYVIHCIPPKFPNVKITKKQTGVSDGLILVTPLRQNFPRVPGFMAIIDNNGVPRYVRDAFPTGEVPMNFQRHDTSLVIDGRQAQYSVTHYTGGFNGKHVVLDKSFDPITTVETTRPSHNTNGHDFLITEDGTFLFSSRRTVSRTVNGGARSTYENIIEEVSATGDALWSWSSWDHLTIDPDCLGYDLGLGLGRGISAHINALTLIDGDVVASSRGCAQVVRIDRSAKTTSNAGTDVVWQLGGTDRGLSFPDSRAFLTISGDDNGLNEFCRQHHATETATGKVVLFDNGVNCLSAELEDSDDSLERGDLPTFSRVVEYAIDSTAGTAAFSREFRLDRTYGHAPYTGSVDLLANGNWLFTWGYLLYQNSRLSAEERAIAVSEADSSGTEVLRVNMWAGSDSYQTFRAYRESETDVEIPLNLPAMLTAGGARADESEGEIPFKVELRGAVLSEEVTVEYETVDGTARAGQDYVARSGTLTFAANSAEPKTILVPILDDKYDEPSETFTLRLRNPTNATLMGGRSALVATGTIADDDVPATPPGSGPATPPPGPETEPEPEPPPTNPEPAVSPTAAITVEGAVCEAELCRATTGEAVRFADTSTGTTRFRRWDFGDGTTTWSSTPVHAWSSPGFFDVTLEVSSGADESTASLTFLVEAAEPAGTCVADANTRCLRDSRYSVMVDWRTAAGAEGRANVVHAGTNESAMFSFFDRDNWEVLVKVLDGCALNGRVWIFSAATTDLGYSIRVTDTVSGAVRKYRNEPGAPAPAIGDDTAFAEGCQPRQP